MVGLFLGLLSLIHIMRKSMNDPQVKALGLVVLILLAGGSFFFRAIEGWSLFDSFYFSVITLATVGYGDLTPHTTLGKMFDIVYIFLGVGILASFITVLAQRYRQDTHKK